MITREEAFAILNRIRKNKPDDLFHKVDDIDAGMRFVLIYLSEHPEDVYSTTIANIMNVSRARVAVLIKKLESKGLIKKYGYKEDKRISVLKITDNGNTYINELKDDMISTIIRVIDTVGIDEINQFIDIGCKIKKVLREIEGEKNA